MMHFRSKHPYITTALLLNAIFALAYPHPGGMHPQKQIDFVKEQIKSNNKRYTDAFHALLVYADSALLKEQHALTDFSIPGFYVNPNLHRKNKQGLEADAFYAYACALAWQLSGKAIYADRALYFLNAWGSINQTYSEADGPLVLSYSGSGLLMAAELMRNYNNWKQEDKDQFATWVKNVYRKAGNEIRRRPNNWADWGRFASVLASYYLDDEKDMAMNLKLIKADLFDKIAGDGHLTEEVKRESNGIWYTYFSLAPITAAAWVLYNATHENLFQLEKDGRSIKKALDYLLLYQQQPADWPWFKNPRIGQAKDPNGFWPANLIEAMLPVYNSAAYDIFLAPHRPIIYNKHHFAWVFPTLMPVMFTH
ncbi:alginate lyase family protein [Filimonas effusa]|nr:alginate lyase family protein [Filimonas effusa]